MQRPEPSEIGDYFHRYIDLVPAGDPLRQLERQGERTAQALAALTEPQAMHRYAPGKWSVKEVLGHLADTERVMTYRALRFARGDGTELPGFDENLFVANAGFDQQTLPQLIESFRRVRQASLALFQGVDAVAERRSGIANGKPMSVRGIGFIVAGHELHHLGVLRERYGIAI